MSPTAPRDCRQSALILRPFALRSPIVVLDMAVWLRSAAMERLERRFCTVGSIRRFRLAILITFLADAPPCHLHWVPLLHAISILPQLTTGGL